MKRIITGLALIGVGFATIMNGGALLAGWLLLVGLLIGYELSTMLKAKRYAVHTWLIYAGVIALSVLAYWLETRAYWNHVAVQVVVGFSLLLFFRELITKRVYLPINKWVLTLRVMVISGGFLPFVFLMREAENGLFNTWFCFVSIWAGDIFAYYGGKLLGKHKLSPISPKKTMEGAAIGILGSMACAAGIAAYFSLSIPIYAGLAAIITVVSQMGDLHESLIKRQLNAKDSSQLLPGHGGFYDRADSTLFTFPVFYYIFLLLG